MLEPSVCLSAQVVDVCMHNTLLVYSTLKQDLDFIVLLLVEESFGMDHQTVYLLVDILLRVDTESLGQGFWVGVVFPRSPFNTRAQQR